MKLEERKGDMTKFFIILTVNHCIRIVAIGQGELVIEDSKIGFPT